MLFGPDRRVQAQLIGSEQPIMFGGRFLSSYGILGVDVGSRSIKLLQVRAHGNQLTVVGAAEEEIERAPASGAGLPLAQRLRSALASGGFTGRRCVVSLPRNDLHLQAIRLPRMAESELRKAASWEAVERFGLDPDAMEVDIMRTGVLGPEPGRGGRGASSTGSAAESADGREEILLVAVSHETIFTRLEPILEAGLRPVAIDTHFCALARLFSRRLRRETDQDHVQGLLEVGYSGSTILILRGDRIAFCKPVEIGGRHLNEAVAEHLQLDLASAAELRAVRTAGIHANAQADDAGAAGEAESVPASDAATNRAIFEATRPLLNELVKEVTLCLRYHSVTFRGRPPEQIILTGVDGHEAHLAELLSTGCKIPVQIDDDEGTLSSLVPGMASILHRSPGPPAQWAVAAGLSIRDLRGWQGREPAKSLGADPGSGSARRPAPSQRAPMRKEAA